MKYSKRKYRKRTYKNPMFRKNTRRGRRRRRRSRRARNKYYRGGTGPNGVTQLMTNGYRGVTRSMGNLEAAFTGFPYYDSTAAVYQSRKIRP